VTPACHQRGRKITPRASAKRLSSAQPAARTYQLCCHLRYTPVSPMMWRGVLGVPDMRHSWRPPAGGRWQGSDERRQLGLSRRGHCWPTRRDPMSFASAARAAFALISVVTMINVGRGGEYRPRMTVFRRTRRPLAPTGYPHGARKRGQGPPSPRRRPGSGSAAATRRGSWRGRGGRAGPRPRATRRANPSYARCPAPRRTLHWG